MIAEVDRYHGVVLRQLVAAAGRALAIGAADENGRLDSYRVEHGAIHVKHSSKRLSPWQFTYMPDNIAEIKRLQDQYNPVWVVLVCGLDGVVGLTAPELLSIMPSDQTPVTSIRVRRSKNGMYRISGSSGELPRAKSRGVAGFVTELSEVQQLSQQS